MKDRHNINVSVTEARSFLKKVPNSSVFDSESLDTSQKRYKTRIINQFASQFHSVENNVNDNKVDLDILISLSEIVKNSSINKVQESLNILKKLS